MFELLLFSHLFGIAIAWCVFPILKGYHRERFSREWDDDYSAYEYISNTVGYGFIATLLPEIFLFILGYAWLRSLGKELHIKEKEKDLKETEMKKFLDAGNVEINR